MKQLCSFILCFCVVLSFGQLTNGQLVHYSFDGNLQDIGANGLHATPINNPIYTADAAGNPNSAIQLNGSNQYIEFPNSTILKPTTLPVSFSFWVNPVFTGLPQSAWCTSETQFVYHGFWFNVNTTFYAVAYGDGIGIGPSHRRSCRTQNSPNWGNWQHVVCIVRGPQDIDIYIDCQLAPKVYSGSAAVGPTAGIGPGNMGRASTGSIFGGHLYLNGSLDEFRMWNRALTTAEIQQLCQIQNCPQDSVYFQDKFCSGRPYNFNGQLINTAGQYTQTLTNADGCDSIVVLDLSEINSADTSYFNQQICQGESFFFNGSNRTQTGQYVSITAVSAPGTCDSVAILNLVVIDAMEVNITDTICQNDTYQFGSRNLDTSGTFIDTLKMSSSGCDSIVTLELHVHPQPDTLWISQIGDPCRLGYIVLRAHGNGPFMWDNGQMTDTLVIATSRTVTLKSFSACGFKEVDYAVEEDCLPETGTPPNRIYIPNVFTPNGDNVNDTFFIQGSGILEYEILIFNRWGEKLFHSDDINDPWDGTYRNQQIADGVYVYVVNYLVVGEENFQKSGTITVFH